MITSKSNIKNRIMFLSLIVMLILTFSPSAGALESGVKYTYSKDGRLLLSKNSNGTYMDYIYSSNGNLVSRSLRSHETFEMGGFETTNYISGNPGYSGIVTNDPTKVVIGAHSVYGESDVSWQWNSFLTSDPSELRLEPNTSYSISFKFRVIKSPTSEGNHYFFSRTNRGDTAQDKGWVTWNDKPGVIESKVITFTTGSYDDYRLYWGTNHGGAISIDDIEVTKIFESFEGGKFETTEYVSGNPGYSGVVTNDSSKVVTGAYSVYGEGDTLWLWNTFLASNLSKRRLEPNTSYTITFKYKVIKSPNNEGNHYFFSRTSSGDTTQDKGWITWNDKPGGVKSKVVTFTTGPYYDYRLYWGTNNGGAISIDDIQVLKVLK